MFYADQKLVALIAAIAFASLNSFACAQSNEQPRSGIVYNTKESNSLTYRCSPTLGRSTGSQKQILCEFTQTSIRAELDEKDLESEIARQMKQYTNEKSVCEDPFIKIIPKLLDGSFTNKEGIPIKNTKEFKIIKKSGMLQDGILLLEFCDNPTRQAAKKLSTQLARIKTRTCRISSNRFDQTFKQSDSGDWIVVDKPTGPCGIIRLDRFEKEKSGIGDIYVWNYVARKAITNPNGKDGLLKCNKLDEEIYPYSWKEELVMLDCDRLKLTPF